MSNSFNQRRGDFIAAIYGHYNDLLTKSVVESPSRIPFYEERRDFYFNMWLTYVPFEPIAAAAGLIPLTNDNGTA